MCVFAYTCVCVDVQRGSWAGLSVRRVVENKCTLRRFKETRDAASR